MKIFYLGPEGSFSHIIAKHFSNEELEPQNSFLEIITKIKSDKDCAGILPVENSSTSDVHENIDYIFNGGLRIIEEQYLKINLHLIGFENQKLENITKVYSHPKALSQCSEFLIKNKLETEFCESTSASREKLLERKIKNEAIIGSLELAKTPLKIIESHIGNSSFNLTRFVKVVHSDSDFENKEGNKMTILFKVKHEPGSLAQVLSSLAKIGVNLMKIESRPIPDTKWEYQFWMDIEVDKNNHELIFTTLKNETLDYKLVGLYNRGDIFES